MREAVYSFSVRPILFQEYRLIHVEIILKQDSFLDKMA